MFPMFQFDWPVDSAGYQWIEQEIPGAPAVPAETARIAAAAAGFEVRDVEEFQATLIQQYGYSRPPQRIWVLEPRGGPQRFYRPLDEVPGLFRRFAKLTSSSRDEISEFTHEFGLLGGLGGSTQKIIVERLRLFKLITDALDVGDQQIAATLFNDLVYPKFTPVLDASAATPRLAFKPSTLFGAMVLQLADEICGGVKYRKCKQCPEWFRIGRNEKTLRRQFCSDRCRGIWHREHRDGGDK